MSCESVIVERAPDQSYHQLGALPPVYTLDSTMYGQSPDTRHQGLEPVYQEIGHSKEGDNKRKVEEKEVEPNWAPKPNVVYGMITAKEVARYIPCNQTMVVRPDVL